MPNLSDSSLKNKAIHTALKGDWETAITLNQMLLEENPKDVESLNRIAMAYTVLGKISEAKAAYQRVFEIDPLNSIAQRNLKKLRENTNSSGFNFVINTNFLEETGKTKIVELVNIAQPNIIQELRTGQSIDLICKRSRIFVQNGPQYIGVFPDDIGSRLIKFIESGNKYESYIKSANPNKVHVFIKEVKRCNRFKNQPSFAAVVDSGLEIEKSTKSKIKNQDSEE